MNKNTLAISLYRFPILLFFSIYFCAPVFAQSDKQDDFSSKFQQYQSNAFTEKLFLHLDKSCYLAGEVLWFKIYDADGYLNRPLTLSTLSYVEIITKDHRPVLQTRIGLKDGVGNGSFVIPASLVSGNYVIRAYTAWMKNFSPEYYFEKQISVINTISDSSDIQSNISKKFDVQFFPEGGNLVNELTSKVGFKAVNQFGEGVDCKGVVFNQKNDTLVSFQPSHGGMGYFMLTPVKGDQYFAKMIINDTVITRKLPVVFDHGYVMLVTDMDNDKLKVIVHTNVSSANPGLYLFTHSRQFVKNAQANFIANGEAVFYLDKKNMPDGISHLTVFNAEKKPVCERLYFKQPVNQLHIEAKNDQQEYSTRKKVNVSLVSTDQNGKSLAANLSMSVFLIDSFQTIPQQNILNYFLLTSDLKGNIENPQYYFGNRSSDVLRDADNLMLTQGWSRFNWDDVLRDKKPLFEYLPETEGPIITGKIIDKRTGMPAPSVTAYLSLPDTAFEFSTAMSKANGDIRFNLKKYYGNHEIIVQTNYRTDSNFRVDIQNGFSEQFSNAVWPAFYLPEKWQDQLLNRSINAQVENTYLIHQKNRILSEASGDSTSLYGRPDLEYKLDDYTRFVTMEEVMREYVADVRIRKESGKFYYRVRNDLFNTFFEDAPLLLIDGVPIFDADKIVAFDPLKIKKIDVVSRKYYLGSLITDGIVSYKTYEGDLAGYQLDPNAVVLQYNGLQQEREFYSPIYESRTQAESRIPDFRNVLLWSPDIKTDTQGKNLLSFYTSDITGKYAVIIQGMTSDGLLGSKILTFNVTK